MNPKFFTQKPPQFPAQHDRRRNAPSPRPEPRLPGKHSLNPPIVTVLGAGIAGLTAAHELVERGFLVQVVESEEDPYCPGRPLVGGLAANQPARVRANIEDLHPRLLDLAQNSKEDGPPESKLAKGLIELFAFNRRTWVATEVPARIRRVLYSEPSDPKAQAFVASLLASLKRARDTHREQWIWDLVLRSVLVRDIVPETWPHSKPEEFRAFLAVATTAWNDLNKRPTRELALKLNQICPFDGLNAVGNGADEGLLEMMWAALEREFLCFRLIPRARRGFEGAPARARKLYTEWCNYFEANLPGNCLSQAGEMAKVAVGTVEAPAYLEDDTTHWVEIEIIEQRLPGEHGFRFFPSFYRHIDDTMRRIPLFLDDRDTGRTVLDNLKPTIFQGIGFNAEDKKELESDNGELGWDNTDRAPCDPDLAEGKRRKEPGKSVVVELKRDLPRSIRGLRDRTDRLVRRLGGTPNDAIRLFAKIFRFMTSSPERRRKDYEGKTWSEFLNVSKFSKAMRAQIESAAQVLVAFSVTEADARTYGNIAMQLLFDQLADSARVDRTLNGPTSDAWLEPWREYLERQGVRFFWREVTRLEKHDGGLVPIFSRPVDASKGADQRIISQDGYDLLTHEGPPGRQPDFYVLALNFEKTFELVSQIPDFEEREAPDFNQLLKFWQEVERKRGLKVMTGLQYFFEAKTSLGSGHMYFPLSPWGLSSISQSEFWSRRAGFSDGYFGVLSVGVCSPHKSKPPEAPNFWAVLERGTPEVGALQDERANRYSLARKIWDDVRTRISESDRLDEPKYFHIDQKLRENPPGAVRPYPQLARFLASLKDVDRQRPGRDVENLTCVGEHEIDYSLNFERWVMCSTFMATHTRLTTMEAANESARHAVKTILRRISRDDAASGDPAYWTPIEGYESRGKRRNLDGDKYNGQRRVYDMPDIFNPEDCEMEDLDILRRIDRRLLALDLGHFLDIIQFDRKLEHALEAVDLYGNDKALQKVLGLLVAGLDSTLVTELGKDYEDDRLSGAASKLKQRVSDDLFPEMKKLLDRLATLSD